MTLFQKRTGTNSNLRTLCSTIITYSLWVYHAHAETVFEEVISWLESGFSAQSNDWRKRENILFLSGVITSKMHSFGVNHISNLTTILDHILHALDDPVVTKIPLISTTHLHECP